MKKMILSAITILTIGFANAQETKFGIKAGLNLANVTGDSDNSVRPSFYVGGLAEIKVSDKFFVQPELVYSSQGVVSKSNSDYSLSLGYLNIPIMAKYMVADGFALEAGPQVGFLLSATTKTPNSSYDSKNAFSAVDFSLGFGAGYDIGENFNVGLRYNLGLTKLNKDSFPGVSDIKNSVFQIGVAYKF